MGPVRHRDGRAGGGGPPPRNVPIDRHDVSRARRRWISAAGVVAALAISGGGLMSTSAGEADVIGAADAALLLVALGRFKLVLTSPDEQRTPGVAAELLEVVDGQPRSAWRQLLPHRWGPRTALVADGGAVVLVDEWINSLSSRAMSLLAADGRTVKVYGAEELIALLDRPRRAVADAATYGPWLTGEPSLAADGRSAVFRSAGRMLTLSLDSGTIEVSG